MKTCTKCGESKPPEAYSKHKNKKDGMQPHCKACTKVYNKRYNTENSVKLSEYRDKNRNAIRLNWENYYIKNHERLNAARAEYRLNNIQHEKARNKQYRLDNKDKIKKRLDAYELANPGKTSARQAEWKRENKLKVREMARIRYADNPENGINSVNRRRALRKNNGILEVKTQEIAAIVAQPCAACAAPGPSEVDHIVPLNRGGAHTIGNLMPLCRSCNSSKSDLLYIEWKYSARPQALKAFAA